MRKKAKYALITNEFHYENFFDLEDLIDLSEFKKLALEKTSYYDYQYWTEISYNSVINEDEILKEFSN